MTSFDRFERSLPALLDELAAARTPDYFDDILARTAATTQRPGWTFPERWLPMSALTSRLAAAPRIPWRLAGAVALLLLAALIGLLVAGSKATRLPAPFGPAANGRIVFTDDQGHIVLGDPATSQTTIAAAGVGNQRPQFSPDGAHLAFLRGTTGGHALVVTGPDGAGEIVISPAPLPQVSFLTWSPDSEQVAVLLQNGHLRLYDAMKAATPIDLTDKLGQLITTVGGGDFNEAAGALFRPPAGAQILVVGAGLNPTIVVADRNGSNPHVVLDPQAAGLNLSAQGGQTRWSPDGSKISFAAAETGNAWSSTYVMNADGSGLHRAWTAPAGTMFDEHNAQWSPDGTKLATQRWELAGNSLDNEMFHPIGIVDLATGSIRDVGPSIPNGYSSFAWSPDGKYILEVPGDDTGKMLLVNVATGTSTAPSWTTSTPAAWQRVTPR